MMRAGGEVTAGESRDSQLTVQPDIKLSGEKVKAFSVRVFIASFGIFRISRLYRPVSITMPPRRGAIGDLSDDDYVARVLAKEAQDNTLKYTSEGLGAYMPKKFVSLCFAINAKRENWLMDLCDRPSGAAPKPNTRFLRHIIRETDNHNAALKRKEEREARERIRQLRAQGGSSSTSASHDTRRHRQHTSDGRDRERERRENRDARYRSHRRRDRSYSASLERERSRKHRRRYESEYDRHRYSRRDRDRRGNHAEREYSRRHGSYSRSRSRSPRDERGHGSHRSRRHRRHHSRSPSRSRSRTPEPSRSRRHKDYGSRDDYRSSHDHRSSNKRSELSPPATDLNHQAPEDSDPLEDLVGPLPNKGDRNAPIRSRGRGAYKPNTSTIDSHFAEDYDPTLDVHLDDNDPHSGNRSTRRPVPGLMTEDDDWELALEAFRDRARWKQKGEERLRQAGFSDSTVERWKSNSAFTGPQDTEGQIEDVKWTKKGEGREWDRGKVFDEGGHVDVKASW